MQLDLVERARSGDAEAFSVLARTSTPRLYGVARLILRDPDRAQDAVQDALIQAWRHVRALREASAWDAWLYRLTVRACRHQGRTTSRRAVVELQVVPEHEPAHGDDFPGDLAEREWLGREIEKLPIDQRTVMVMHFFLDLTLTDAAAVLDVPVGTAKSRLNRGLAALRTSLEAERSDVSVAEERLA